MAPAKRHLVYGLSTQAVSGKIRLKEPCPAAARSDISCCAAVSSTNGVNSFFHEQLVAGFAGLAPGGRQDKGVAGSLGRPPASVVWAARPSWVRNRQPAGRLCNVSRRDCLEQLSTLTVDNLVNKTALRGANPHQFKRRYLLPLSRAIGAPAPMRDGKGVTTNWCICWPTPSSTARVCSRQQ